MQSYFLCNTESLVFIHGAVCHVVLLLPPVGLARMFSLELLDHLIHKLRKVYPFNDLTGLVLLVVIDEISGCLEPEDGVEADSLQCDDDKWKSEDQVPEGLACIIVVH